MYTWNASGEESAVLYVGEVVRNLLITNDCPRKLRIRLDDEPNNEYSLLPQSSGIFSAAKVVVVFPGQGTTVWGRFNLVE
ncbi:MAG: hypothetical protein GC160_29535 [Acidobacteria bacterium]|nr:hypothetical protein [Acidobacteriota bacterium]